MCLHEIGAGSIIQTQEDLGSSESAQTIDMPLPKWKNLCLFCCEVEQYAA